MLNPEGLNSSEKEIAEDKIWTPEKSRLVYAYPLPLAAATSGEKFSKDIPVEQTERVGPFIIAPSPDSHIGPFKQAQDFLVEDGTPILASRDGDIVDAVDMWDRWGPSEEYSRFLNYITIRHRQEISEGTHPYYEYSQYCHLSQDSISNLGLERGAKVSQGQQIGIVGKTGWTDRDHLHFVVFRTPHSHDREEVRQVGFKSLIPQYLD